jgi:O-antigen/teichoic acid export membrane protein
MLRQALPIGASELVWAIRFYSSTIWLAIFVGGAVVGWFGAAHRIVVSLHTFVWLYFFNLLPSLSRCTQQPIDALQRLMRRSIRVTTWASVLLGIGVVAFVEPIVALLYGDAYGPAVTVLQWLIWIVPLALLHGHFRYALIAYGHQRLEFVVNACGAGLSVLLNLLLVPTYGLVGAAFALLASELLILGLASYYVRRAIARIPVWREVYRPILAGAALVTALSLLPTASVMLPRTLALVAYLAVLVVAQRDVFGDVRSALARNR